MAHERMSRAHLSQGRLTEALNEQSELLWSFDENSEKKI